MSPYIKIEDQANETKPDPLEKENNMSQLLSRSSKSNKWVIFKCDQCIVAEC